jgi:hypothetical protein
MISSRVSTSTTRLVRFVKNARQKEWSPPFILCLASRNGAIRCLRVDHAKTETLAETKQEEFILPITMMVLDQHDEAAHVTITTEGPRFH